MQNIQEIRQNYNFSYFTVRAWDAQNSLVEMPKHVKIENIADGGRQRAVIWEMSDERQDCTLLEQRQGQRLCVARVAAGGAVRGRVAPDDDDRGIRSRQHARCTAGVGAHAGSGCRAAAANRLDSAAGGQRYLRGPHGRGADGVQVGGRQQHRVR